MSRNFLSLLIGISVGIMIGYQQEEEIDDLCRKSRRIKKQMIRNMHNVQDYLD